MIVDFAAGEGVWQSIDDVVMGGVSRSEMLVQNGVAVFRGVVSLENGGGFASVRSLPASHDLSRFDGLVLRVKGDGRSYRFRLRTTAAFDGPSYEAPLHTSTTEWEEITLPFASFRPVFRGRPAAECPPLDPSRIRTFGLMISEGQDGPFRLELASISGRGPA